ncbi:MAG: tRNA lysidine(34) synthetase TilS [Saprospiraceae bacterium]|nr:tRNA lysidine(34) synthetase TilS [Saprospiraceae bacterium]
MIQDFLKFASEKALFQKGDRLLLAVSGGIDSVVMAHLFWEAGFDIGLAHCNFQLRGTAADEDAIFVENLAVELEAPFYSIRFNTAQFADEQGISIQMAARQLRYEWLEEKREEGNYTAVATAHHLDDSIETLLYNFSKGCGLHGLHGVPVRQGRIIRPMLYAYKATILNFAENRTISYREDQSNFEDKYARNHIRNQVIPAIRHINPSFSETATANIQRLQEAGLLMDWAVTRLKAELTENGPDGSLRINLERLRLEKAAPTLLYEWLKPYGFHAAPLARILHGGARTGAILYAHGYRLLLNRGMLLLEPLPDSVNERSFEILPDVEEVAVPDGRFEFKTVAPPDVFDTAPTTAYLSLGPADYPLRLRHWQPGDAFQPLGMQGRRQKIQDLFSNLKLSRFEKSRIWLLETIDGHICWIAGLRIDERFKIRPETAFCVRIDWIKGE